MKNIEKYIILILSVVTLTVIGVSVYFGMNSSKTNDNDKTVVDTNNENLNNNGDQTKKIKSQFVTQLDKSKLVNISSVKTRDLNKLEEESQVVIINKELTEIISYSYNYKDYKGQILLGNFKINSDGSITLQKFLVNDISYDEEYNIVDYKKVCDVSKEVISLDNNKAKAIYGFYYEPADAINVFLITEEGYIYISDLDYNNKNIKFEKFDNNIYKDLFLISLPLLDAVGSGDEIPFGVYGQTKDDNLVFIVDGIEEVIYKEEQYPHIDSAFGFLAIYKDSTFKIMNTTDFIKYNDKKLKLERAFTIWESLYDCIYLIDNENYLYKLSYEYNAEGLSGYKVVRHNEFKIKNVYFAKEIEKLSDGTEYEIINNIFVEYENNKIENFMADDLMTYNFGQE